MLSPCFLFSSGCDIQSLHVVLLKHLPLKDKDVHLFKCEYVISTHGTHLSEIIK